MPDEAQPEEHLVDLLDRVSSASAQIAKAAADPRFHSLRVWLIHHTDNENPGFSLSDPMLNRLIPLGTGLEMDIYACEGEQPVPTDWQDIGDMPATAPEGSA